jgi:hypothetical protein
MLIAACRRPAGRPAEPAPSPSAASEPHAVLQVPFTTAIADLRSLVEGAIPLADDVGKWSGQVNGGADRCRDSGYDYAYHIERDPVHLRSTPDGGITVSAHIRYAGAGRARPRLPLGRCGPPFTLSCGYDGGDQLRGATISFTAKPELGPDWSLRFHAGNARAIADGTPCEVSFLGLDITDRVMGYATDFLNRQLATINDRIAADPRPRALAQRAWALVQEPLPVGSVGWLTLAPQAIGISSVVAGRDSLTVTARIAAQPVITLGAKPPATQTPLPENSQVSGDDSIRVVLPVLADYATVAAGIARAFHLSDGGIRYPPTGRSYVKPTSVDVMSSGSDLVIRVGFTGAATGVLYLAGTPVYDTATHVVSVPNLDYTPETRNVILRLRNWLGHDDLRDDLRAKATLDLTQPIEQATTLLTRAMNQTVGPVTLTGSVGRLDVTEIGVDRSKRQVRALVAASGRLAASVAPQKPLAPPDTP